MIFAFWYFLGKLSILIFMIVKLNIKMAVGSHLRTFLKSSHWFKNFLSKFVLGLPPGEILIPYLILPRSSDRGATAPGNPPVMFVPPKIPRISPQSPGDATLVFFYKLKQRFLISVQIWKQMEPFVPLKQQPKWHSYHGLWISCILKSVTTFLQLSQTPKVMKHSKRYRLYI